MNKDTYIRLLSDCGFLEHLVSLLTGDIQLPHGYQKPKRGEKNKKEDWTCGSLADAYQKYDWYGDYAANKEKIRPIKNSLRDAFDNKNQDSFLAWSVRALVWGGVANRGSVVWLGKKHEMGDLIDAIGKGKSYLEGADDGVSRNFRKDCELLMNSGMTKIYAFLSKASIIYDGRVGAALGLISKRFCEGEVVPESLRFPWGIERKSRNTNSSDEPLRCPGSEFPKLESDGELHARWNLRANWLLGAGLEKLKSQNLPDWLSGSDVDDEERLRRIEAALFMIGYVVNPKI